MDNPHKIKEAFILLVLSISILCICYNLLELCDCFRCCKCPKCKKNMDAQLDPYYYKSYGECVDCRAVTETKLKVEGKWKEYINTTFNKEIDININKARKKAHGIE